MVEITSVQLRTGVEAAEPLVRVTMLALKVLMDDNPIAFYELVMKCRDQDHQLWGNTSEVLERRNLLQPDGTVHDATKEIVLAATEGEELEMRLTSPVASGGET